MGMMDLLPCRLCTGSVSAAVSILLPYLLLILLDHPLACDGTGPMKSSQAGHQVGFSSLPIAFRGISVFQVEAAQRMGDRHETTPDDRPAGRDILLGPASCVPVVDQRHLAALATFCQSSSQPQRRVSPEDGTGALMRSDPSIRSRHPVRQVMPGGELENVAYSLREQPVGLFIKSFFRDMLDGVLLP